MSKGVPDPIAPGVSARGASAAGPTRAELARSLELEDPASPSDGGATHRRRRRRHHRHHRNNLQKRSGKGFEFAFVTLLALAILFWVLYALLPRTDKRTGDESSSLAPAPCILFANS
jgi:hypothetical protein